MQYNFLTENIEEPPKHPLIVWLARLAFIGFCASIVSDSFSNSLRVVKTYRQVNDTKVSYCKSFKKSFFSFPKLYLSKCNATNTWKGNTRFFFLILYCLLTPGNSRSCEIGCATGWYPGPIWPGPQDENHCKWSAGHHLFDFVEAVP